jgi:hypothetical protein
MEYFGSYVGVIATLMDNHGDYDWLSFRVPDYPDWGTTKKNINDYFTDYI